MSVHRLLALLLLAAVPAGGASAQTVISDLRIGGLAHDVPDLWSGFQLEDNAVDLNIEVQFRAFARIFGGELKPALGGTINTRGDTSKAYLDARWETANPSGIFFGIGLGVAVHDGKLEPTEIDRKALGSRALFHIPAEIGWRWDGRHSVSVYFEHMSNAYTQRFNEGMDGLGIRYGYRF